jgi:D-glycero-D-manno-heptose 1,7-bisphosphate phosphatase
VTRRRAVFLDRDGVLNESYSGGASPHRVEELKISVEARAAVTRLKEREFLTVIVTNQPDVARGLMTLADALAISACVRSTTGADAAYTCTHDSHDACPCRKPKPGLLLRAAGEHSIDLADSWLIGDRWVDVAAAQAAGVGSVLLERDYSWRPTSAGPPPLGLRPTHRASSLTGCVDLVLAQSAEDQ